MKTITMTQARRELGQLIESDQEHHFTLTSHGQAVANVTLNKKTAFDAEKAKQAQERLIKLGERVKILGEKYGATATLRKMRDA